MKQSSRQLSSSNLFIIFIVIASGIAACSAQRCPKNWVDHGASCYKFSRSPPRAVPQAEDFCQTYQSNLVAVNSLEEHRFINDWLRENDPQMRLWHTSGREVSSNSWRWDTGRTDFTNTGRLWLTRPWAADRRYDFFKNAAYNFSATENRWGLVRTDGSKQEAFICELSKEQLAQAVIVERTIDYGSNEIDKERIPRGPKFTTRPQDVIFDVSGRSQLNYASLKCVADGFPSPIYRWYKEEFERGGVMVSRHIDPLSDARYTQTDGTLIISGPDSARDRGKYHCTAENPFGKIVSETVTLSFGYIYEFVKKRSPVSGKEYWGKAISCDPPARHPSKVTYLWTRYQFPNFIEEDRRVFVSHDGNLYFSSLEKIDRSNYSCAVQSSISSTGRTGPYFSLIIDPASSGQKLLFPNNFPKSFPEAPLAGTDIRIECFSYGYPVPHYNWTRTGVTNQLPVGARIENHNRVLIIPQAKVIDQGEYQCTATSGSEQLTKSVVISIQAKPYFTIPLEDQILKRGASLNWVCEAFGIPEVRYSWYKNGMELNWDTIPGEDRSRIRIKENVLTIDSVLEGRDEGMYQCRAENSLGTNFTTGQLRVLTMKPSFAKHKLPLEMYAAVGGNLTIPCVPEAIPFPNFAWRRNGQAIALGGGLDGARIQRRPNGYLHIFPVQEQDDGVYTCIATNEFGSASTEGYLTVFQKPLFVEQPAPKVLAGVNETVELPCYAHVSGQDLLDVAYIWTHNGIKINFDTMPQYAMGREHGYLNITNITLAEAGEYMCIVKTALGRRGVASELFVEGPPGRVGAVLADELTSNSAVISWSDGSDNGRRTWGYNIEGRTNHEASWSLLAENVTASRVLPLTNRREIALNGLLSPWSKYEFRIIAINDLGAGPPSEPSPQYSTLRDKPFAAPSGVGGGGGKSGVLTITWTPLRPGEWNAPNIWYKIYYRLNSSDSQWQERELDTLGNIGMYTVNVGEGNYYTAFEVMVQAINELGAGPTSIPIVVFSAEDMPQIQPKRVFAAPHNSTALRVSWEPLSWSREQIRGQLVGYRIKYWRDGTNSQRDALTLLKRGLEPTGLIVGLQPYVEYWVAVMAYNDAGSGPESEAFSVRTYKSAPKRPPTSVDVKAIDRDKVIVTWRGITSISTDEEPVQGYRVKYWDADQPVSSAMNVERPLEADSPLEAVIPNLVPGKVYKLRVLAYSLGGEGKMSSPAWEFRVGEGLPHPNGVTSGSLSSFSTRQLSWLTQFASILTAILFCISLTFVSSSSSGHST